MEENGGKVGQAEHKEQGEERTGRMDKRRCTDLRLDKETRD